MYHIYEVFSTGLTELALKSQKPPNENPNTRLRSPLLSCWPGFLKRPL